MVAHAPSRMSSALPAPTMAVRSAASLDCPSQVWVAPVVMSVLGRYQVSESKVPFTSLPFCKEMRAEHARLEGGTRLQQGGVGVKSRPLPACRSAQSE